MIRDFIRHWRWQRDVEAWSRIVTADLIASVRVIPPLYDWSMEYDGGGVR